MDLKVKIPEKKLTEQYNEIQDDVIEDNEKQDDEKPKAPKYVRGRAQRRLRRIVPIEMKNDMENFLLNHGKASREGYNSATRPFFSKYESQEETDKKDVQEVYSILAKYKLPKKLEILFQLICNPHVEYYFNDWTLISLDTLGKHFDAKVEDGQERVIDFAHYYIGMGHCIVCSVDVEDKKIFFRRDGGSNGYERQDRYNKILEYEPKDDDKYEFDYWLKLASEETKTDINKIKIISNN